MTDDIFLRLKPDRRRADRVLTDVDVARRAYELYVARGRQHGHDLDDWLQAEGELRAQFPPTARADNTSE